MIDFLSGKIAELTPAKVILEVNGMGFDVNISLNSYTALQDKEEAKVYIYENIREDAWVLYGFASKEERELFLLLISVSGIGGNTARTIQSSLNVAELCRAIADGDERQLKSIKGLGARTAQRIIVELRDKIPVFEGMPAAPGPKQPAEQADPILLEKEREAIQALTMLGFSPAPTKKVVNAILKEHPDLNTEAVIKLALKSF